MNLRQSAARFKSLPKKLRIKGRDKGDGSDQSCIFDDYIDALMDLYLDSYKFGEREFKRI